MLLYIRCLLFSILCSLSTLSYAATFVVDDSYDGSNPATACEQPAGATYYQTIAAANTASAAVTATSAHIMRICPGTYAEDNIFNNANHIGMAIEGATGNAADVIISASNTGLYIREQNMIVRNISVQGGATGIRNRDGNTAASNMQLENLVISGQSTRGIFVQATDASIDNVTISNVARFGIRGVAIAHNLRVENIVVSDVGERCIYVSGGGFFLQNATVNLCGKDGVFFNRTAGPQSATLNSITVVNVSDDGLFAGGVDATGGTIFNVSNVNVSQAGTDNFGNESGINLASSSGGTYSNLSVNNVYRDGITLSAVTNSMFNQIDINDTRRRGLYLTSGALDNTFTNVEISNADQHGLFNNGGDNNTFQSFDVHDNANVGVFFRNDAINNQISNFMSYNNVTGVSIENAQDNRVLNGDIYNNQTGVDMFGGAQNNVLENNYVHDNTVIGLTMRATGTNINNSIFQNCFINPAENINYLDTGSTNNFDNGAIGNFYGSVPAGTGFSETCTDADVNTICDATYTVTGPASDVDNFPSTDLTSINAACIAQVLTPTITVQKTADIISDPLNNTSVPKAIPGSIVEYSVQLTNSGEGVTDVDTLIITDNLPGNVNLVLGSPLNPVIFTDGAITSGMSFTFDSLASTTDDISFSNDGGSSFITPSVDAQGIDSTVPKINYIEIKPRGIFNADTGSGSPSFMLQYHVEIQE